MDENNLTRADALDEAAAMPAPEEAPAKAPADAVETAAPDETEAPAEPENSWDIPRMTVVDVRFKEGGKVYYFDPGDLAIRTGDHVIVETARGIEYGFVANGLHRVPERDVSGALRPVVRLATEADEKTKKINRVREKEAYRICQQEIERLGLEMQLASAEVAFDGSKILFFFTADGRVDFRELVKSLASAFHTRIELRQIGVRDKAKMIGGLGMCGRPFCCSEFLTDFQPVSIKMAKTQNLSLNPTKISGTCGRLMCCLKYEQEAYEDLIRSCPKNESFVDTPEGRGTVIDVNLLRQTVKVRMEKQPDTVQSFSTADIAVWRNGKSRKTDPPIPDDWAPISSDPNRRKKADEPIASAEDFLVSRQPSRRLGAQNAQPERENRGNRGRGRSQSAPKRDAQQPAPAPQQPAPEPEKKDAPKQPRRGGRGRGRGDGAPKQPTAENPQAQPQQPRQQGGQSRRSRAPQQPDGAPKQQRPPRQPKPQNQPAAPAPAPTGDAPSGEPKKRPNNRRRHRRPSGGNANGGAAPQSQGGAG